MMIIGSITTRLGGQYVRQHLIIHGDGIIDDYAVFNSQAMKMYHFPICLLPAMAASDTNIRSHDYANP